MEMRDGDVVNLGIGLPVLVTDHLPAGVDIILQSENGMMGMGPAPGAGLEDSRVVNAGGRPVTMRPFASCFDSAMSFGLIRGGHVDVTVLGALEVDESGSIANWIVPGKLVPGMGGAMDLVVGAKKVIVAMLHRQPVKSGEGGGSGSSGSRGGSGSGGKKILKRCTLPLTAVGVVDMIVTEMCVMEVRPGGLVLTELHPDYTVREVREATGAKFTVADDLAAMPIPEEAAR
jgi:acetate CoA/acetoacetate CoA-transferase beta subunit